MKKFFRYLLLGWVFLMLVACGKPDSQKAFESQFKEFNSLITKEMKNTDETTNKMVELISKATYKINKVEENGDNSQLNVTIKAVNLGKYMNEFIVAITTKFGAEKHPDKKELYDFSTEYFTNLVNDKNLEYVDTEVNVQMQKIEGQWRILNVDELVLAIIGGAPLNM